MIGFFKKLKYKYIWQVIIYERLTEPIHLNLLSLPIFFLGSVRLKTEFDLIVRQHNAYSILKCADRAKSVGVKTVSIIEFGVASGAGLMNMSRIAARVSKETGVSFKIYGFDTGKGMPPPKDWRDHPDLYQEGDFEMDVDALRKALPQNTKLIIGNISETVDVFLENLNPKEPIGFVVIDVDYYSSAKDVLRVLQCDPETYLPISIIYLDDINLESHNSYCGELLAIQEFNAENKFRKIEHDRFLENSRLFKRANWIKHIYQFHVLDHPIRCGIGKTGKKKILKNPYLG